MGTLTDLRSQLLKDGKITENEVGVIRAYIHSDGKLDIQDVRFLVELLSSANYVCPEFDALFFPALKDIILADGSIGSDEQFYLLKMLYSDGEIRESETQFLLELRSEVRELTPEFEALCETALAAHPTAWDVGGQ